MPTVPLQGTEDPQTREYLHCNHSTVGFLPTDWKYKLILPWMSRLQFPVFSVFSECHATSKGSRLMDFWWPDSRWCWLYTKPWPDCLLPGLRSFQSQAPQGRDAHLFTDCCTKPHVGLLTPWCTFLVFLSELIIIFESSITCIYCYIVLIIANSCVWTKSSPLPLCAAK